MPTYFEPHGSNFDVNVLQSVREKILTLLLQEIMTVGIIFIRFIDCLDSYLPVSLHRVV